MSDFILPEPIKDQIVSTPGTFDILPPPREQQFTEAEKASSVINQIRQMPDPSEGIARLYASKHLADRLGKTMAEVFRDFDAATAQYYGEIRPPKDWLKAIGDEMKIQSGVMKMGRLGSEAAHAKTPEEFAEKWEEYIATKRSLPDPDTISRSFPVEMTKQTLGLVSQMLSTIPESWDVGLAAGAGGAGIAALVGGPVLTTAGLMYVAGSAGKTEYGNAFMEMLESGVDFDIAKAAAYGPGILNGLGEAGQYALLVKGLRVIPGVSPILDKAISKTLQSAWVTKAFTNKALQFAGKVIGGTAGEVSVELAQESTTMAFTALAKYFQNESRGTNLPQATIEEVTERLLEIGKTSAMGFAGLSLISTGIGSIRSGFKTKKAETKQEKAQAPEGAKIPEKEAPTPTGRPREQVQAEYDEAFRVLETNPNDAAAIDKLTALSIELETGEVAASPRVDLSDDEWLSRRRGEATEAATTEERNTLETFKTRIQENVPGMDNPQDLEIVSFAAKKFADSVGVDPDTFLDAALVPGVVGPELEGKGVAQGAVAGAQFVKVNDKIKMALRFTESANGSSVVHELSHAYINFLRENATMPEVSKVLQDIEKTFGIEGGNWDAEAPGWTEDYQGSNRSFWEYYSYSLEDYIQTGQAPNAELKGIFDRIIQWLKEVYRDLSRRTEVSPEVQQYFDRLFSAEERTLYQSGLYHGTGATFDKFSTDFMGTGEGHQAFGWGLYFTSNEEIARHYANLTTGDKHYNTARAALIDAGLSDKNHYFDEIMAEIAPDNDTTGKPYTPDDTRKIKEIFRKEYEKERKQWEQAEEGRDRQLDFLKKNWDEASAALDNLIETGFSLPAREKRNLYKVTTNEGRPEVWLDWNVELSSQPEILSKLGIEKSTVDRYEKILAELNKLDRADNRDTDEWRSLVEEAREIRMRTLFKGIPVLDSTGEQLYNDLARTLRTSVAPGDKEASILLKSLGIDGNRFPAASGGKGDGSAGYNYVVFDAAAIEIEERILFQERAEISAVPEVRDDQGRLLAPNGKPSNLNEFQWKQVRTPAFLKWFGDWINDPANASKVVDENGEPMVVYHGTDSPGFDVFEKSKMGSAHELWYGEGFYFTGVDYYAKDYGANIGEYFIVLKNPIEAEHTSQEWSEVLDSKNPDGTTKNAKERGYDGIVVPGPTDGLYEAVVFDNTQIKSATANIGTFDPDNPSILYQGDKDAALIQEDVEATRWVPDSILERYRSTEWGKSEIDRRDELRREAAEFEDEAEFVSFQMTMDPEATPAQREYYQRIYESRESVSAEPVVSREDANRRFLDSLDKPGLEALISNLIGQNFDDLGPVFRIMDHKLFSSAVKTVRGGGHLSDGHYKKLMDQIRYDVTGFRDAVLVAAGDQDEYAQFIKEVITDKTAEELEQRKRELSALKREIDKKTTTIESLTRDIERERFYSKNIDNKLAGIAEALSSAREEAGLTEKGLKGDIKARNDALRSARSESAKNLREVVSPLEDALRSARKEAASLKKEAERRIRDLYETRAKVTKLIKLIVKPPSKAMHWKEQKRLLQLQSTYITGLSKTQKEHRARLASILERVTEPDLIAKIKAELGIRNLKEMTIEELENLATQVQGIRRNGIDMRKLKLLEEKIQFHADKDKILEALEPLMKEQIQGRMSKEGKKAAKTKLLKNIGLKALTPERVMEMFQGKTEGPFKELFIDLINEATDQQIRNEMERQKKLEAALERNNLKLADLGKTVKLYDFTYTRQDILGFYLQMQNEESKAALLGGDRITEAQAREFIAHLTEGEKRFADELADIVGGDAEFNRIEESIGENRNELMGRVERYFPMLRQNPGATAGIDQQVAAEILERKGLKKGGVRHGFSKSRVKIKLENQKPIRHDSVNVAFQQITAQERYIAMQPALKRLGKIVNDSTVQDAMIRSHGYEAVQWMQKYIGDLANPDIYNDTVSRTSRFLRNNAATAFLAFNALTILKQFPSVLYYLGDVGPHHLIHAAGQFFHNPAALIREVKAMDPQVARRSIDRVFEELRQIDLNAWEKAIKKITVGMRGIALMDMVSVTIGWKAVYNAELAKSGDPGKAIKRAQEVTMRTQPSARVQNLPEIYRTNEGLNWLLMFTNQLNKIFNMVAWDIPMSVKEGHYMKALGYTTAILMSGVAMGAISRKRPPEDPGELAEDIVTQVLNSVPIIGGNIVAGLSGWGDSGVNPFPVVDKAAGTFKDIFGGEKDMEEIVESIGRTLLEGMVLTGLPQVATKRMYKTFIDELGDFQFNPWELIGGEPKE